MNAPPPIPPALPERRLATPDRDTLLAHYARTESTCKVILALEAAVALALLGWIISRGSVPAGPWPWIALALGGLGVFRWFAQHAFLNKKRIEHIRPDAQFGVHTRDSLVALAGNVFDRLELRRDAAPVFLTRAKDINAHAIRCELWPGQHLFNGVFLNRSIIHLLDEPELASVIGHELGHVFPYSPLLSRCYILHSAFAGVASLAAAVAFPFPSVSFVAPLAVLWILDRLIHYPHQHLSRAMEFLCDDHGARAAGLLPALSSELKIAVEQETRQRLLLRAFESRQAGSGLNLNDLAEAYENAVPFGKADPAQFEREFQKLTDERKQSGRGISAGGFLEHLGGGGDSESADEFVEQQLAELRLLESIPLLTLDREPYLRGSAGWTPQMAERLANRIEAEPSHVLVRLGNELVDHDVTHPGASRRMLFLWRNRHAYPVR